MPRNTKVDIVCGPPGLPPLCLPRQFNKAKTDCGGDCVDGADDGAMIASIVAWMNSWITAENGS